MQINSNESYSEISGKTWSVISIIQEYSMPENYLTGLCSILMHKKKKKPYCIFISHAGLLIITVSYTDAKLVWLFQ